LVGLGNSFINEIGKGVKMSGKRFLLLTLILLISILSSPVVALSDELPSDYIWHQYLNSGDSESYFAVEKDSAGNVYALGSTSRNENDVRTVSRVLQKYDSTGNPIAGSGGAGTPWWIVYTSGADFYYLSGRMIVDETNRRLYVLYSTVQLGSYTPVFFLAVHDLDTGQKVPSWNYGSSKYIGSSSNSLAGLDFDSDGNIWTVVEEEPGGYSKLRLKKWSGVDGNEIALPGGSIFAYENAHTRFVAFAINRAHNKIMLAARKEPTMGDPTTGITAFDTNFQWLGHRQISLLVDIPPPPTTPGSSRLYPHPLFSDGLLDSDGNFYIAGHALWAEWMDNPNYYDTKIYPVIVKVDSDLNVQFQWVSESVYNEIHPSYRDKIEFGPKDTVLYSYFPILWGSHMGPGEITLVNRDRGLETSVQQFNAASILRNYDTCYNTHKPFVFDFAYIPGVADRLVIVGRNERTGLLGNLQECSGSYYTAFCLNYGRTISGRIRPEPRVIDFETITKITIWVKENWDLIFPPSPAGPPVPEFSALPVETYADYSPISGSGLEISGRPIMLSPSDSRIFKAGFDFVSNIGSGESYPDYLSNIKAAIKNAPIGKRFNNAKKKKLLRELESFKGSPNEREYISKQVIGALNDIDLDRITPEIKAKELKQGKNIFSGFGELVWVNFSNLKEPGKVSLNVSGVIPALAKGYYPGWPMVKYDFDIKGKFSGDIEVSFFVGGIRFPAGFPSPRILEWNGKFYTDITTKFDAAKQIVSGKTENLLSYVILSGNPSKNRKELK
jgi:hypothetical protein